jgi:hypothetical protein
VAKGKRHNDEQKRTTLFFVNVDMSYFHDDVHGWIMDHACHPTIQKDLGSTLSFGYELHKATCEYLTSEDIGRK